MRLPRWIRSCSRKNTDQGNPSWTKSVQLHFWKASAGWLASLYHPYSCELITQLRWLNLHLATPWTQILHLLNSFKHWKSYKGTRLLVWMVWKLSSFWMRESCYTCHYWQHSTAFWWRLSKSLFHWGGPRAL